MMAKKCSPLRFKKQKRLVNWPDYLNLWIWHSKKVFRRAAMPYYTISAKGFRPIRYARTSPDVRYSHPQSTYLCAKWHFSPKPRADMRGENSAAEKRTVSVGWRESPISHHSHEELGKLDNSNWHLEEEDGILDHTIAFIALLAGKWVF